MQRKNILMVVVLTAVFTVVVHVIAYGTAAQKPVPPDPEWSDKMSTEEKTVSLIAGREQLKILVENKQARISAGKTGALAGAAVGLVLGVGLAMLNSRKAIKPES